MTYSPEETQRLLSLKSTRAYTPEEEASGRALLAQGNTLLNPTPAAAPTPSPAYPTIASLYGTVSQEDADIGNFTNYYKGIANTEIDEGKIRSDTMKRLQLEIDATNQIYAQKLAQAKQQGQGRIGSDAAIQARRGLLGSDFGTGQTNNITSYNNEVEGGVRAEQNSALAAIYSKGYALADAEIVAKNAARQQGAESYIKFLTESENRRTKRATTAAQAAFASGIDLTTLDKQSLKQLADSYQVAPDTLMSLYRDLAKQAEAEAAAAAEAERKAALEQGRFEIEQGRFGLDQSKFEYEKGKPLSLSEGETLFDPTTGRTIYKNPKTYAPKAAGSAAGTLKETGAERNALGFYLRGKDALDTIAGIEPDIQGKNLAAQTRLEYAPNFLQSQENQIYRQLQRQFTEARLRKESGAAIPNAEYISDSKTYFAQPGDTKETLERKRVARSAVLESLKVASGNAYANYYSRSDNAAPTSNIVISPDEEEIELID